VLSTNRDVRQYVLLPCPFSQKIPTPSRRTRMTLRLFEAMNNWLRNYFLLVPFTITIVFQTNQPSIVYILLYGNRILVSDSPLPCRTSLIGCCAKNCLLSLAIALATALFLLWAMTPFPPLLRAQLLGHRGVLVRQRYIVFLNPSRYLPPSR
jgi:hypothetical protein